MLVFLVHLILTAALLLLVSNLVQGVYVQGWGSALVGAIALGFVNAVVRPLMVLLTLPFTILTFGCQTALKSFHNFPGKIVEKFPVIL